MLRARGRPQLMVCGVFAHIGCQLTVADAVMRDIEPFFVADALADFSRDHHDPAVAYVSECCGIAVTTAPCLRRLSMNQLDPESLSRDRMRAEIAATLCLSPDQIGEDENLIDLGLDSLRAMALVLRWQERGLHLDFAELAEQPTLAHWWILPRRRTPALVPGAGGARHRPGRRPDPDPARRSAAAAGHARSRRQFRPVRARRAARPGSTDDPAPTRQPGHGQFQCRRNPPAWDGRLCRLEGGGDDVHPLPRAGTGGRRHPLQRGGATPAGSRR